MIRQAISCDVCGTEKRQTNHWFVVYDQGEELRVGTWSSRNRLRPGTRHLCGQTCLHKLLDEFLARSQAARPEKASGEIAAEESRPQATDTSLTGTAAWMDPDFESSARLLAPEEVPVAAPSLIRPLKPIPLYSTAPSHPPILRPAIELAQPAPAPIAEESSQNTEQTPRYTSRTWRAEAWEREREREIRAVERHPEPGPRRRLGS